MKGCAMVRAKVGVLIFVFEVAVLSGGAEPAAKPEANRWEEAIRQFEEWDSKNTYASDAVLFVGSSSIRMWRTRECFGDLPVINRGFGGSQICDVNYFAHRIVLPYRPKVIVFYAGDNDIAAGKSPQRVFDDYRQFVQLVHDAQPKTRIIFVSIKPSGSRWSLWPEMKTANLLIKEFCEKDGRLFFFDAATPLLGDDGRPNAELFLSDQLHLNSKGYKIWTERLRPIIRDAMKSRGKG